MTINRLSGKLLRITASIMMLALLVASPGLIPYGFENGKVSMEPKVAKGAVINVDPGSTPAEGGTNFQAALNSAQLGDEIVLQAGAVYQGNFVLPYKSTGSGWITIRSSNLHLLPEEGNRVSPSDAVNMPRIQTATGASGTVFTTVSGANPSHHYKLIGLEIARASSLNGQLTALVEFGTQGSSQNALEKEPHHFVIDRSYLHGDPTKATRRGLALNARNVEITNSYFEAFHEHGADSQAILGWNTSGNIIIRNNYLEGGSENVMFGGQEIDLPIEMIDGITIEYNHFHKPLSWKTDSPNRGVKNLLEFKNGTNATVRYNIFENVWAEAQTGYAIVFTPRDETDNPGVTNILFEYNIIKNAGNGFQFLTDNDYSATRPLSGIVIKHNLVLIAGTSMGTEGRLAIFVPGQNPPADDITFEHNTVLMDGTYEYKGLAFDTYDTVLVNNFTFNNNIMAAPTGSIWGIFSSGGHGTAGLNISTNTWEFNNNILRRSSSGYPGASFYAPSLAAIGFEDAGAGNFKLSSSSTYKGAATDETDPGVDWDELMMRTANVVSGEMGEPEPGDTTPPVMSNGAPSGTLIHGTTQTNLSLTTDEAATCKYSTNAGHSYAAMPNTFGTTGGTSHTTQVSGLTNGSSYTYYVKCIDGSSNANTANLVISFSIDEEPAPGDTTPPVMSNGAPSGQLSSGTTQVNLTLNTNEPATCKYSTNSGHNYAAMPSTFSTTGSTNHSTQVTGLSNGQSYAYYVRCEDGSGNANPSSLVISFSVKNPSSGGGGSSSTPPPVVPPTGSMPTHGTNFICQGSPTIYYLHHNTKLAYSEYSVWQAWNGDGFGSVASYPQNTCTSIMGSSLVPMPEGTIIRVEEGPEIYLTAGPTARPFTNFQAYLRDSSNKPTYTVSLGFLHTYSRGVEIN